MTKNKNNKRKKGQGNVKGQSKRPREEEEEEEKPLIDPSEGTKCSFTRKITLNRLLRGGYSHIKVFLFNITSPGFVSYQCSPFHFLFH